MVEICPHDGAQMRFNLEVLAAKPRLGGTDHLGNHRVEQRVECPVNAV